MDKKVYEPIANWKDWEEWSEKAVANLILSFFVGVQTGLSNWGFYLFDKEFEEEQELRNRISAIWVHSLLDVLDGEQRVLRKLRDRSEQLGSKVFTGYCDQMELMCRAIEDLLRSFSKEEQIFIRWYREQVVHSWLAARQLANIRVRIVTGDGLIAETLTHDEFNEVVRTFDTGARSLDEIMDDLLTERLLRSFNEREHRFWAIYAQLHDQERMRQVMDQIYKEVERLEASSV